MSQSDEAVPKTLFVTGRLAAAALQLTLERLAPDFPYETAVLNGSVAALMRTEWIARRLHDARGCELVVIPGLCRGDLSVIERQVGVPVVRGPKDLRDLPRFYGQEPQLHGYGAYKIKLLAEIVEAWHLSLESILAEAERYRAQGADIIDLGCPPMEPFVGVGDAVAALKERGFVVSIDTFHSDTIREADDAGVDLVLSVNSENIDVVPHLHCKVVVVPDFGEGVDSLERNVQTVAELGAPYVLDPILDPLGMGFTESVVRFQEVRRRYPTAEMLMGVGNLTELLDADSHGVNAVIAGVFTELQIDYVLTTEVISWCRGAVRELDVARRLMYYARTNSVLPKSIDDRLIALKDVPFRPYTEVELRDMQSRVRDRHYRIFADAQRVYVFNRDTFVSGTDPQRLFEQLEISDPGHAFYMGRELERAALAVLLGKRYTQESGLRWGYLDDAPREVSSSAADTDPAQAAKAGGVTAYDGTVSGKGAGT